LRDTTLGAYTHQELPCEKLIDELKPPRDLSRTPLFQVFFNMLNLPSPTLQLPGLTLTPVGLAEAPAKFDLTGYAAEKGDRLELDFVYDAGLFDAARMEELLRQYAALLGQIVAAPELPIDRLSLVTEAVAALLPDPRRPLGDAWMGAVHERFALAARRSPERLAVIDRDEAWSYRDLELRANRLAAFLLRGGVSRGDVVAIYGHRSARLVWAVMAVMKAGAVFTILDPAHPPARLIDCLDVAAPRGFLAVAAAGPPAAAVDEHVRSTIPCRLALPPADALADPFVDGPADDPCVPVGPDDLAYVAFTSGSTGLPKGILGRHGPLSHFLPWQRATFGLSETDRFSMLSGLSHDPLQRDMFTPLQMGAVLCVPDPAEILTPGRLAEWMRREAITVAHLTPAMGQLMTERAAGAPQVRLPALRCAFFVGDVLTRRDVARLEELAPNVTCVNFYGSTETQRAVGYHRTKGGPDAGRETGAGRRSNLPLGRGMEDVQL